MKSSAIQALYGLKFRGTCEQFATDFNKSPLDCLAASGVDIDDLLLAQVQLAVAAKNNIISPVLPSPMSFSNMHKQH